MLPLPEHGHDPVLVHEVLHLLDLAQPTEKKSRIIMDCTAGRGGHAAHLASALAQHDGGTLIALDVDPDNLQYTRHRLESANLTGPTTSVQLRTFHANFAEASDVLEALQIPAIDALLADFGVSTNQLLDSRHGLSFNTELSLDMRLDPRIKNKASDLLAQWNEKQLATTLLENAQEKFAWRIARKIVQTRATEPILTTGQLARLVRSVVPAKWGQIDPATRTFQALRMAVNAELESIEGLLDSLPTMINPNGRAALISFHSGEDRLVKQALKRWEEQGVATPLTKKPVEPGDTEMQTNPRSRSAKLRAVQFNPR